MDTQNSLENLEKNTTPIVDENAEQASLEQVDTNVNDSKKEELKAAKSFTKQNLYDKLSTLIEKEVAEIKDEVESIKQTFYKLNSEEVEEQRKKHEENSEDNLSFIPVTTVLEEEFKALLQKYKDKKAKHIKDQNEKRESNLLKKKHIIEQIKKLTETKEDVSANISQFRQLQQDWKNTGDVPVTAVNDLWKEYNKYQEEFWDLIKINNELREYDFKKNLEAKEKICVAAEELDNESDVVKAFRSLQNLHNEWRELGPVGRELRETIWNRFKNATAVINKKHQAFFEELRGGEKENLEKKEVLCERLEAIDISTLATFSEWDSATKEALKIQSEWREIGFAPRKDNKKIYERYRTACDKFFEAKTEFLSNKKTELNDNFEKKKQLCEQAEALKDSEDWKKTSDILIKIQKDWKKIGPVQRKQSDVLWKRFNAACDFFFDKRNENFSEQRKDEVENLQKKSEITEKIKGFVPTENKSESIQQLKAMTAEWNAVGFVPFKEKDKIYKEFHDALDEKFSMMNIDASQRRLESFKTSLEGLSEQGDKNIYREREKLVRTYDHLKSELHTYENNLGFFSVSSKKGGGMLKEMERRIEKLKDECKLIEEKIKMIDGKI